MRWSIEFGAFVVLLGLAAGTTVPVAAQDSRSLRNFEPAAVDELDLPRYRDRVSHRGWEHRSSHFVVVSPRSAEEAQRLAARCEATWARMGSLADRWTSIHRGPRFGNDAVAVFVVDAPHTAHPGPIWSPTDAAELYIDATWLAQVSAQSEPTDDRLERAAAQQFLRVAGWENRMPIWLQAGLTAYVGEEMTRPASDPYRAPSETADTPAAPGRAAARPLVITRGVPGEASVASASGAHGSAAMASATAPGQAEVITLLPPLGSRTAAAEAVSASADESEPGAWVRFLLESEDGRFAPEFIRWVALEATRPVTVDRRMKAGPGGPLTLDESVPVPELPSFLGQSVWRTRFRQWQADRWRDQPLVAADDLPDAALADPARQLAVLWKLVDRFGETRTIARGVRVTEFQGDRQVAVSAVEHHEQAFDLERLAMRAAETAEPWAMIDGQGQLAWSGAGQGLAGILPQGFLDQVRADWSDEQATLSLALGDGRWLVSWVDPLPSAEDRSVARAARPRIRFRISAPLPGPTPRTIEPPRGAS